MVPRWHHKDLAPFHLALASFHPMQIHHVVKNGVTQALTPFHIDAPGQHKPTTFFRPFLAHNQISTLLFIPSHGLPLRSTQKNL